MSDLVRLLHLRIEHLRLPLFIPFQFLATSSSKADAEWLEANATAQESRKTLAFDGQVWRVQRNECTPDGYALWSPSKCAANRSLPSVFAPKTADERVKFETIKDKARTVFLHWVGVPRIARLEQERFVFLNLVGFTGEMVTELEVFARLGTALQCEPGEIPDDCWKATVQCVDWLHTHMVNFLESKAALSFNSHSTVRAQSLEGDVFDEANITPQQ